MPTWFGIFVIVALLDALAYGFAKYPERTQRWYYRWLIGGGFAALLKLGKR